jgi:hypothetical protein
VNQAVAMDILPDLRKLRADSPCGLIIDRARFSIGLSATLMLLRGSIHRHG